MGSLPVTNGQKVPVTDKGFCSSGLLLYLLDPSILVWERDTLHFFILEYSCASLIPVEYSCLAAVFGVSSKFLYVSCVEL